MNGSKEREGSPEILGPQTSGTIVSLDLPDGRLSIQGEDGKLYNGYYKTWIGGQDAFNNLSVGDKVTFKELKGERHMPHFPIAADITIDTQTESHAVTNKTQNSVLALVETSDAKNISTLLSPLVTAMTELVRVKAKGNDAKNVLADSPECSLEDGTFRIDSTGWENTTLTNAEGKSIVAKVNTQGDVWELENGEQLFTQAAMIRETVQIGREGDVMTATQAQWLLKNTPNNIPTGCQFTGFVDSRDGKLHFSGSNACYWIGEHNEKGDPMALFCIDVDEEMRDYVDEMVLSSADSTSAMQVRFIKKS